MSTIQVRITNEDKKAAQKILADLGLDLPTAIRVFLKKVRQVKGVPFEVSLEEEERDENGLTKADVERILKASEDAKKGINVSPAFDDIEEAINYLHNYEDDEEDES